MNKTITILYRHTQQFPKMNLYDFQWAEDAIVKCTKQKMPLNRAQNLILKLIIRHSYRFAQPDHEDNFYRDIETYNRLCKEKEAVRRAQYALRFQQRNTFRRDDWDTDNPNPDADDDYHDHNEYDDPDFDD
jgi:hypothetical protein